METKLRQIESEAERFSLDFNYGQGRVESIMTCVQQIFNLLDCEDNVELLGSQGVTESNMMTHMGIIEQRINEILQANTYITQSKQFDEGEGMVKFEQVNLTGFMNKQTSNVGVGSIQGSTAKKVSNTTVPKF